jgi:hypothetical protein
MAKLMTLEEFIKKANLKHDFKYDYSGSVFINTRSKIKINCLEHGNFEKSASDHLKGAGCQKCSLLKSGKNCYSDLKGFINKANIIHNFYYDYSKTKCNNFNEKLIITCKTHGDFLQTSRSHLRGNGCYKCGQESRLNKSFLTNEQFISKAQKIHGNEYDYSLINYKNSKSSIEILCAIHGIFKQTPSTHLSGCGCPKCNTSTGWTRSEWINFCNKKSKIPVVYIIRCFNEDESFIKIGITSTKIEKRFKTNKMPYSYEVLKEIKGSPDFIFDKEHELHKLYKKFKYIPQLLFHGSTECFSIEILNSLN